jgi:hypothetical protein
VISFCLQSGRLWYHDSVSVWYLLGFDRCELGVDVYLMSGGDVLRLDRRAVRRLLRCLYRRQVLPDGIQRGYYLSGWFVLSNRRGGSNPVRGWYRLDRHRSDHRIHMRAVPGWSVDTLQHGCLKVMQKAGLCRALFLYLHSTPLLTGISRTVVSLVFAFRLVLRWWHSAGRLPIRPVLLGPGCLLLDDLLAVPGRRLLR